jgi:hypothetical protein
MERDEPWVHPDILPAEIVKVTDSVGKVWVGYHVHEIERGDGGITAVWLAGPRHSTADRYAAGDRCRIEPLSDGEMRQLLEERRSLALHQRAAPTEWTER